jgi:alcohol dehydrogenase
LIRVTTITICGTDLHIVKGEYPVRPGLVIGHEPVGVIAELGAGVAGYNVGDRAGRGDHAVRAMQCLSLRPSLAVRAWQ